jgi:hypothetical protein
VLFRSAITMNPRRAQAYTASKYFIRYILTGVVLLVFFEG